MIILTLSYLGVCHKYINDKIISMIGQIYMVAFHVQKYN